MTRHFAVSCFAILVMFAFVPDQALGQGQTHMQHQAEVQTQGQAQMGDGIQMLPIACYDKTNVLTSLETNFNEIVMARGIHSAGVLIEVLVSAVGTFTILITTPAYPDQTCVLALGSEFELITPPGGGDPSL